MARLVVPLNIGRDQGIPMAGVTADVMIYFQLVNGVLGGFGNTLCVVAILKFDYLHEALHVLLFSIACIDLTYSFTLSSAVARYR